MGTNSLAELLYLIGAKIHIAHILSQTVANSDAEEKNNQSSML